MFGPQTQSRNRNIVSCPDAWTSAAQNTRTWLASEKITELTIFPTIAGAGAQDGFVYCVLNAPSDAIAQAWLDPTISTDGIDVQWYKLKIGEHNTIQSAGPITRIDFEVQSNGWTAGSTDIWIGAN